MKVSYNFVLILQVKIETTETASINVSDKEIR